MSNISKVFATYNGQEFECVIGQEYEFSDDKKFKYSYTGKLRELATDSIYSFGTIEDSYQYIRPVQKPKELTCDELYRICGKKGYEVSVKKENLPYGIIHGYSKSNEREWVLIGAYCVELKEIACFRPAYSKEEWKPISQIEREI